MPRKRKQFIFATMPKRRRRMTMQATIGEMKFHDLDIDDATISTAGDVTASVNLIADGTLDTQRIGRKSVIRELHWNYRLLLPAAVLVANTSDIVTLIVYLDKQANGAALAVTTVLEAANYQSFNRIENKDRIRVLMRRSYDLKCRSGGGHSTQFAFAEDIISDSWHKTGLKIPIQFSGATGAITEIKSNNIGVIAISAVALATLDSKFRVRFTDS